MMPARTPSWSAEARWSLALPGLPPRVERGRLIDRADHGPVHLRGSPRAVEGHARIVSDVFSLSVFVPSSYTEQWMPHSLSVSSSHHQRPARSDSPGITARVHGAQPIEV
jgi:hypothetical protein